MLGYYNYTVWLTYLSLISGSVGIYSSFQGHPFISIICLLIAGFLDMFDGKVARTKKNRTNMEKNYGIQIDSLTDLICFGVLPICIGYSIGLHNWYYVPLFAGFVLFGMIRLAWFNVNEMERQQKEASLSCKFFQGVPITTSAIIFPIIYCFKCLMESHFYILYAISMGILGLFFVIKVKICKPNKIGSYIFLACGLILLLVIILIHCYA